MKKLGILLLACITALNLWAEEFKIGKFTFEIETPTTVRLSHADKDITKAFLSETIDYEGNSYTITSIGEHAFLDCSSLTSVTIPNSVTSIKHSAFRGTALYENPANWENGALYINNCLIKVDEDFVGHFRIKENTRPIAGGAFEDCTSLTSVTIPNSVTSIGVAAFLDCSSLTSVTIPNSVTSIGALAFEGCKSLTSVTISNSVTSIGYEAFEGCKSLKSVTIPNSVTSIGEWAFRGTALYENPANWENGALYMDDCLIKVDKDFVGHFRIKENTRVIAGGAFYDCSALTSVTIPNSVTSIGDHAFQDCSSLTSMVVASGNNTYDSRDNCNAIIETATNTLIAGCQNTTIPNSVTSIGDEAFYDCSALTSITIPNSVKSIGWRAFLGCESLTSVTIPNSVTSIENYAFSWCSRLTSITIPNSVKSIGWRAFWGCEALTSVTIPNSVTSIVGEAFSGCSSLTSVTIPNSVTRIENYAFYECTSLKSVTIPNSVTSIGWYAFPSHTQIIRQ